MQAGTLRRRITFQVRSTTRDSYGAEVEQWNDVVTLWGQVLDRRGSEFLAAQQYEAQVATIIYVRYYAGLTPAMRAVTDGARTFDVQAVLDTSGLHRQMELTCLERVGQ